MKYNYGTEIYSFGGKKVGELENVVIDPSTKEVTDLVARKGFLLTSDKVIPISLVMEADEGHIKLYDFKGSYDDLDDFIELHYVKVHNEEEEESSDEYGRKMVPLLAYMPAGYAGLSYANISRSSLGIEPQLVKNVPEGTKNISKGAHVLGMEGKHVGNVEEVIVEPESNTITHFVISKGLLFKDEKLIPASWVSGFDDHQLKLVVNSKVIEELPEYEH